MRFLLIPLLLLLHLRLAAQHHHPHGGTRALHFADTDRYRTLVCDFHIHTVFSDGSVWPDIRIQEALRDSLDAVAMTEHLEYQPHADDIPHPDRNRSHELATGYAEGTDLLVVPGAEITRSMPPGHSNALFIRDANALLLDDSLAVFEEAARQGAFTFWNHPNWTAQRPDGIATLTDFHRLLIDRELLHGIEVVNDLTISKEALQIALDNDLTIMGTSDIHGLVDYQYDIAGGGHRPATLVLATERSPEAIREALFAGRTVAVFEQTLVGRREHLGPVVRACLDIPRAAYRGETALAEVTVTNGCSTEFLLENLGDYTMQSDLGLLRVPPHGETTIEVLTGVVRERFDLRFRVLNAVTGPDTRLEIGHTVTPSGKDD